MRNDDIEPMSDELGALLRAGAPAITPMPGARARVLARVTASVAVGAPLAAVAAKGTASTAAKVLVPLATFLLGGAAGVLVARRPVPQPEPRVVYVEKTVTVAATQAMIDPPVAPVVSAIASTPPPVVSVSAPHVESGINAERRLLDDARAAFAKGDHAECLRKLDLHRDRYPAGQLTEEREALAIRSLASAGRSSDARARADRFRAKYPGSLMLPAVEAAVGESP